MTAAAGAGEEWLAALRHDLRNPPIAADAEGLAGLWSIVRIRFVCARPPLLQDHPDLSVRVRGAWGRKLAEMPSPVRRGWSLPTPYEVLFSPIDVTRGEDELPKPAILRASLEGEFLIVDLSVFGHAAVFADAAADALGAALREGISLLDGARRQRVSVTVLDAGESAIALVDWNRSADTATLRFRTPLCIRQRATTRISPESVLPAVWRRVRALAPWMGVRLTDPPAPTQQSSFSDEFLPVSWKRYSQRQGDMPIPMDGVVGSMTVRGGLHPHLPVLAMAETANIGSHAALGLGWYDLIAY